MKEQTHIVRRLIADKSNLAADLTDPAMTQRVHVARR